MTANATQTKDPMAESTRTLRDFVGLHAGETAWMFGKGPSLDGFDMETAGPLRCAINDVVRVVPACTYCFAHDPVEKWVQHYRREHVLFQPRAILADIHATRTAVPCERIWFASKRDGWKERLAWPVERVAAEGLAVLNGTLPSAEQILRIMGVRRILCVGIDGGGSHASRVQWATRLRADHARYYNEIRDDFCMAAAIHGIEVAFWDAETRSFTNGMKTVRILSNTFCRGQPLTAGQLVDLPQNDADALLAAGRAVVEKPAVAKPMAGRADQEAPRQNIEIETAAMDPGADTPEKKPKRVRRKKA